MRTRFVILAVLCGAVSCRVEHGLDRPPAGAAATVAPRVQVKQVFDPKSGRLLHEWSQLTYVDHRPIKDGVETKYSENGSKAWEGSWKNGKKSGTWRFFYADGQIKSQTTFGGPRQLATMTFWHPNGQVSLQGPAIDGVRQGRWRIWHKDGTLAEEGDFVGSVREGPWKVYSDDGKFVTEVVYSKNLRIASGAPQPCEPVTSVPRPPDELPSPTQAPNPPR